MNKMIILGGVGALGILGFLGFQFLQKRNESELLELEAKHRREVEAERNRNNDLEEMYNEDKQSYLQKFVSEVLVTPREGNKSARIEFKYRGNTTISKRALDLWRAIELNNKKPINLIDDLMVEDGGTTFTKISAGVELIHMKLRFYDSQNHIIVNFDTGDIKFN